MNETLAVLRNRLCSKLGTHCQVCGYRIRGLNHEKGVHHKKEKVKR